MTSICRSVRRAERASSMCWLSSYGVPCRCATRRMISLRILGVNVGLSSISSTICAHPTNTAGAWARSRNRFNSPRRAMNSRIGSDCWSTMVSGIRDIGFAPLLSVCLGGEDEGPVQGHEGLLDGRSVRGDPGLMPHEIGLQRFHVREDRVAADVWVVSVEQLGDQWLVALVVEPEVHMLWPHHGSVCGTHDFPARTVGGKRVIARRDGAVPEPAVFVGGQQGPHRELVVQLLGLLNVVEAFAVAVPGVHVGAGDRCALFVDNSAGDEHRCTRHAAGDIGTVFGRRTALDIKRAE